MQLSTITGMINQFNSIATPIIMGDFQSFPSSINSDNRNGNTNSLSHQLSNFISENDLCPIDITKGTGPTHTYHHLSMQNSSYIDHIIISSTLIDHNHTSKVLAPCPENTSDHLPVSADIDYTIKYNEHNEPKTSHPTNQSEQPPVPNYMWKNKHFITLYQQKLEQYLSENHQSTTQRAIQHLHESMKKAEQGSFQDIHIRSKPIPTKPWWNSELSKSRKTLQLMFNNWRDQLFTRDPDSTTFNRYLLARKKFRTLVKQHKNQATVEHYIDVEKLKQLRPRSYWKQINLSNKKDQRLYTINKQSEINNVVTDFKDHFSKILNNPRTPDTDNIQTNDHLKSLLQTLENDSFYVTDTDTTNAINKLKSNKSKDPFKIKAEHFTTIASNPFFIEHLTKIINNIFADDTIPDLLTTSLIIPVIKSTKKSFNDPNNYRGISIIPIITKLTELIILEKCPIFKEHNLSQFGFAENSSTIHAEFLLNETINLYNHKQSPIYICSLDAEKAFDSCNWLKLFEKLIKKQNIPRTVIKFLIKLYTENSNTVTYRNVNSTTFSTTQGVRQGSILSPYLYNIYTEDLIEHIKDMDIGAFLPDGTNVSILAFADDIILICSSLHNLQTLLDECGKYCRDHAIKINDKKTQFVVSGRTPITNIILRLNENVIHPQNTLTHLGFKWSTNQQQKLNLHHHLQSRISEAWATTTSLVSAGINNQNPHTIAHIFSSIVIPKLTYGLNITKMTKNDEARLNRHARSFLKLMFGISKHARNTLHSVFNLKNATDIIDDQSNTTLRQLAHNTSTSSYVLHLLTLPTKERLYSSINSFINKPQTDILKTLLTTRKPHKSRGAQNPPDETTLLVLTLLENWHLVANRAELKAVLENRIERRP